MIAAWSSCVWVQLGALGKSYDPVSRFALGTGEGDGNPGLCILQPEQHCWKLTVPQSCLALCDPRDCSPPGSSVHGIPRARTLEWVAIPFSRGSS